MKRLIDLMQTVRERGLKVTPQRLMIFRILEGNTNHPSAEEIYQEVVQDYPTISLATIYKTLEALRDMGEILELKVDRRRKRYDPCTNPHHHIICSKCGKIEDIFEDFSPHFKVATRINQRFKITGYHIEFYSICTRCQKLK